MLHRITLFTLLVTSIFACQDDDDFELFNRNEPDDVTGLNYVEAEDGNLDTIYADLITALRGNNAIGIVAEVDHQANAATVGDSLRPTRVVLFGNPNLGTPLMRANPQAGLDLPQKMLVYQADDDDVILAYNTADYLANRHGIDTVATLDDIRNALGNLALTIGGDNVVNADDNDVDLNEGVITYSATTGTVESVYANLRTALQNNADVAIVAELDHQANAASVDMELPPIRLIVFGNPTLGTPLLLDEQSVGIDLPQKMLVYQNGDNVSISFNDPMYIADRHDVDDDLQELMDIRQALDNLARGALGI